MVSVIVPVYNVFPFLEECIDTIRNQTFEDLEIILVDDGSTDQSGVLCDSYIRKDSRIKVIHQRNQGLSGARNTGIAYAHGEYIVFIDSDDRINPRMIQFLYESMQQYNAELAICSYKIIQENQPAEFCNKNTTVDVKDIEILSGHECINRLYTCDYVDMIIACNKLYKRSMFEQLKYPEGRFHEDEFLTYKILYPIKKCVYIKLPLYEYRKRENSIMGNLSINRLSDKIDALEERSLFFEQERDMELYYKNLQIYETHIAEFILYLEEVCFKNDLKIKWETQFRMIYQNSIRYSPIELRHKIKYKIFMRSHTVYKILKELKRERNLWKVSKQYLREMKYLGIFLHIWVHAEIIKKIYRNTKSVYFISTPCHGNLGDQAIVYAQYQLMHEIKITKNIIEISRSAYEQLREKLQKVIMNEDIIIIDGGGNIGTLWPEEDAKIRDIVQRFSQNAIFIFPQTAYYERSEQGQKELKKTVDIFEKHPRLTIFCRDTITYNLMQTKFAKVKSFYTPDMVAFLKDIHKRGGNSERSGVLLCLRDDLESTQTKETKKVIEKYITEKGYDIKETSTVIKGKISKYSRRKKLDSKWKEFSSSELVITDRLHGMIFCAITATPCIALDNISHKVREGYKWINYLPYINFCEDVNEDIYIMIDTLLKNSKSFYFDRKPLEPYYEKIKEEVCNAFNDESEKANGV